MKKADLPKQFRRLMDFVRWSEEDADRVRRVAPLVESSFDRIVASFYEDLLRDPATAAILDNPRQVERLQVSLRRWLEELFSLEFTPEYIDSRWRVGWRHVEIGVPQVYIALGLGRLRARLIEAAIDAWPDGEDDLIAHVASLNKLIDMDQALIEDAYEAEHVARQQRAERRRFEAVLHQEREFSEGLLEHAQAIVLVLDPQGNIVRFNPYFSELSGYALEEVAGQSWFERFVPLEEREPLRGLLGRMLEEGTPTRAISPIVTREGELRQISWSNKVLSDPQGRPVGVLAVGHDITELQESQARALQAERLAAIGRMSTGLAHESRNALQRIQANCEVLEAELEGNSTALQCVARIQRAGHHLNLLLEEVRSYAAEIRLDLTKALLSAAWREAWRLLESQWRERDVVFDERIDGVDLELAFDHFRIVQVFRNLLENSLAACRRDPVRIRVIAEPATWGGCEAVCVRVCDNGEGMGPEQCRRIFEPFYTTKSKGTGLGMALAHRYMEAHGGGIEVGRTSEEGTEIVLYFPRQSEVNDTTVVKARAWTG